jgi:pimeloyl-ACP methyl ester carboxylesterase
VTDLPVHRFQARDGVELAWRSVGSGRPLVLLHGLMGSGSMLASQGPALKLAEHGYRVILPDLRGHGDSGRPHDPACYPPDVLADDGLALIEHLGLDDYELGGYSLGGKLVLRLLARGARPAHAVVGGQGLDALGAESDRTDGHRRMLAAGADRSALPAGSPEEAMAGWIRQTGTDARAVGYVLGTFLATPADVLREVPTPTLVVIGDRDNRGASADSLAALLTALGAPEFTAAVLQFLARSLRVSRTVRRISLAHPMTAGAVTGTRAPSRARRSGGPGAGWRWRHQAKPLAAGPTRRPGAVRQ